MSAINFQDKSITDLKAAAYDLQNVVNHYTTIYNQVVAEIKQREAQPQTVVVPMQAVPSSETAQMTSPNSKKTKKVDVESY